MSRRTMLILSVLVFGMVLGGLAFLDAQGVEAQEPKAKSGVFIEEAPNSSPFTASTSAIRCIIDCELDGEREGEVIVEDVGDCLAVCEIACKTECEVVN